MPLKPWQTEELRRALQARHAVFLEELGLDAARARAEHYTELDQAELAHDVQELAEIEVAKRRLADGSYGICVDCGGDVGFERLLAEPAAARCLECQRRHENTYPAPGGASL